MPESLNLGTDGHVFYNLMGCFTRTASFSLSCSTAWSRQIQTRVVDVAESRLRVLILEREQNYSALLELDEDYETGKLSQEDYQTLRRQLFEEIAAVIAEIETAEGTSLKEEIENYKKRKQET